MAKVDEILAQCCSLGVERGGVLLVHTSFRAVRPVEDGPRGLIRALLSAVGPAGTLVMPTMTDGETLFDPRTTATFEMGVVAETFWRMEGVVRSTHPGGSFAACGPHADRICAPQPLEPPHGLDSPPGRIYALDGQVLLLGVTESESTTLHVAESVARVPYAVKHPCVVADDLTGHPRTILIAETDHCCIGFRKVDAWLRERGALREGMIGHARAKLARSRDVIQVALEHLTKDPLVFLCDEDRGCEDCDEARASVGPP